MPKRPKAREGTGQDWKRKVITCLGKLKGTGAFASRQSHHAFPNPGLEIGGELIPLPLVSRCAELIKAASHQAPFGMGDKTVVDKSVRNTWQLNTSDFHITNPQWGEFIKKMLCQSAADLSMSGICADPYKLLLYEEGSFFKPHKDSEKAPGMVGTLVVSLPSEHEGGDVHLSFGDENVVLETGSSSKFDLTALAWFSDVTHEVKPLTSGHRLVLTYNLIQTKKGNTQSAASLAAEVEEVHDLLVAWPERLSRAVYPLDHRYTNASLSLANLKGRDAAVGHNLRAACDRSGYVLFLANMTRTIEREAECYGGSEEEDTWVGTVYAQDGSKVGDGFAFDESDMLEPVPWRDREADSENGAMYTGNEHTTESFRYHNTVILIVPIGHLPRVAKDSGWNLKIVSKHAQFLADPGNGGASREASLEFLEAALEIMKPDPKSAGAKRPRQQPNTPKNNAAVSIAKLFATNHPDIFKAALEKGFATDAAKAAPLLSVLCQMIEDGYGDDNDGAAVDWDRWLEGLVKSPTLAQDFELVEMSLNSETLRSLFAEWKGTALIRAIQDRQTLTDKDYGMVLHLIRSRHDDLDWVKREVLSIVATRGSPRLIRQILGTIFKRNEPAFANADQLFDAILSVSTGLPTIPKDGGKGDSWADFNTLVSQGLQLGLSEQVMRLDDLNCSETLKAGFATVLDAPHVMTHALDSTHGMRTLLQHLQDHVVPPTPVLKSFVTSMLRERILPPKPVYPTTRPNWAHEPIRCGTASCPDCDRLVDFLESTTERTCSFPLTLARRTHLSAQLPPSLFLCQTRIVTGTNLRALAVKKLGMGGEIRRYEEAFGAWELAVEPFKMPYMEEVLGGDVYAELILMRDIREERAQGEKNAS